jgi:hypothetical protein
MTKDQIVAIWRIILLETMIEKKKWIGILIELFLWLLLQDTHRRCCQNKLQEKEGARQFDRRKIPIFIPASCRYVD